MLVEIKTRRTLSHSNKHFKDTKKRLVEELEAHVSDAPVADEVYLEAISGDCEHCDSPLAVTESALSEPAVKVEPSAASVNDEPIVTLLANLWIVTRKPCANSYKRPTDRVKDRSPVKCVPRRSARLKPSLR